MDRKQIIASIDEEISRLERVRELLQSSNGRYTVSAPGAPARKKRVLSEEARKRIAQAQKRRWARQRKETSAAKA